VDIQESLNDFYEFQSSTSTPIAVTVSAVPELGTFGMLLAGAGLMGAVARRRKNNVSHVTA